MQCRALEQAAARAGNGVVELKRKSRRKESLPAPKVDRAFALQKFEKRISSSSEGREPEQKPNQEAPAKSSGWFQERR